MRTRLLAASILLFVSHATSAQPHQDLVNRFKYDDKAPLDVRETAVEDRGGVTIHDISYASPHGGRVPAYLVVPAGKGSFAAAIWGHWYWGNSPVRNRREFLDEAVVLARAGLVSLLFDGPVARPGYIQQRTALNERQVADRLQTIADVRRGADLLLARPDVDRARLAYIGHSYNASTGGYLAGIDKRFKAFVLMAGSLSDQVDLASDEYRAYRRNVGPDKFDAFIAKYNWLDPGLYVSHAAPAAVLMQFATEEDFLTVARARQYAQLVSEPKTFKVYEGPHALNAAARRDRVEFLRRHLRLGTLDPLVVARVPDIEQPPPTPPVRRKTCAAPDGVSIAYSTAGTADTAIVFIHGGMADRGFFDRAFDALSTRYRVIALDLAGHGESGTNRKVWDIPAFATDVKAVIEAENLKRVVLFGNSLGGPVAIEAALLLPGRVLGVVGIDTFQDLANPRTPEYRRAVEKEFREAADAVRANYLAALKPMIRSLFHPDADPWLIALAEQRMVRTPAEVTVAMLMEAATYDSAPAARKLTVPLRAMNGDIYPTDIGAIRKVTPDFDAVIMKHMGHFPMLERPDEFNRIVLGMMETLAKGS